MKKQLDSSDKEQLFTLSDTQLPDQTKRKKKIPTKINAEQINSMSPLR